MAVKFDNELQPFPIIADVGLMQQAEHSTQHTWRETVLKL